MSETPNPQTTALVRRPSSRLDEGLVTHIDRSPVDLDLAISQWHAYCDALVAHGWEVVEIEPADDCPDGVFIEDTAVVFGEMAVLCRSGAEQRRAEVPGTAAALFDLGIATAALAAPATLDGGDVLKVGSTIYVGRSGRTNDAAIAQLRAILAPTGREVVAVPTETVLHLKSAVTALPDGTVVGYRPVVDSPELFDPLLEVPEEPGAHVVVLDDQTVLMATTAPQTAAIYEQRGLSVVRVDVSEFEKLEGCVTCLSVRVRK